MYAQINEANTSKKSIVFKNYTNLGAPYPTDIFCISGPETSNVTHGFLRIRLETEQIRCLTQPVINLKLLKQIFDRGFALTKSAAA